MTTPTEKDEQLGDKAGEHAEKARHAPPTKETERREKDDQRDQAKNLEAAVRATVQPARPHATNADEARKHPVGVGVPGSSASIAKAEPAPAAATQTGAPD